ncbi:MAG: hypothetical protein CBC66_002265 [Candidatus Pelagibacter sp. TMED106]|nr:MAG: hypothetical protein CBC66_002265 [Candidatus Pelagibacter sp. TMED106]|tara:strand:- start:864 stop:2552 length:1689 start_codon:yes stop_codon:yes gene_type:complete
MILKFLKLIIFIIVLYQSPLHSKSKTFNQFDSPDLSNYFSGIVAFDNNDNLEALKFFKSSKNLIKKHDPYFEKYIYSLILEKEVQKAIYEIKRNLNNSSSNFFNAYLILALDSLKKKDFKKSQVYLKNSYKFINNDRFNEIIYESFNEYLKVFRENKISEKKNKFGNLSFINEVFQRCYLEDINTDVYFRQLTNNQDDMDYSRYTFFYVHYLIETNKVDKANELVKNLEFINNSLLVSQSKAWIENKKFDKFTEVFSCKSPDDILSEFFFLIANIYSSQKEFKQSNFYLNISHFLNPKFKFNLSLLAENYYMNDSYEEAKKVLKYFNKEDDLYYWFKLKKQTQIITKETNNEKGLSFINKNFEKINKPSLNMLFDIANLNKSFNKYQDAIDYYDEIISKIDSNSNLYAEILYRRGGSYERLGDFKNSDKDLLKSLEINPDDAYVLNYLAYSWLERNYKIYEAIDMLEKAYESKSNDPYIIDSIGWAYFLVNDFLKAEKFLKRAVQLMPDDPIVNDHYGDILWKLNRKIQARYFWTYVLDLEDTEDKMKKEINLKLIKGPKAS